MFGVPPRFFIDEKTKFKTGFGSLLTFCLIGIVFIGSWVYGNDIYYREKPNTIFTEESTTSPELFKIDKDTFNFW